MKMFIWQSKALRDYQDGQIIVIAKNVEQARKKVTKQSALSNNDSKHAEILLDIQDEPAIKDVYFVHGSA